MQQAVPETNQIPNQKETNQERMDTENNINEPINSEKMRYKNADEIYE